MPSTLGWIDYDERHRESMQRVLAFFREKESRDELGLGSIRDSISDKLFPGTSTLQTRVRYMLIVPWLYQELEAQHIPSAEIERKARRAEIAMIDPLLVDAPDGVIGRIARGQLKTLPSSIYWAGLSSWGVLGFQGSQRDYHRAFDRLTERRANARRRQDVDVPDETAATWHTGIPAPPDEFPAGVSFELTRNEAAYLRDRLQERHPDSLLACLAQSDWDVPDVDFIWEHPQLERFPNRNRELVQHGHVFARVMHGAAILYNLELSRLRGDSERESSLAELLEAWIGILRAMGEKVRGFDLERFWSLVRDDNHVVSLSTRAFVAQWFQIARAPSLGLADGAPARQLIRSRERSLKRAQSRFDNRVALNQWAGAAGLRMLNYRWPTAYRFVRDLRAGLTKVEA